MADLLLGLSRVGDMGFGLQAGTAARSCALATRMARSLALPETDVQAAFYTALLHHVGCVGYARETAKLFGDELVASVAAGRTDAASASDLVSTFLPTLTQGRPPFERARAALTMVTRGGRWGSEFTTTACEVGREAARRLQLPDTVQDSVFHVYDMWRGSDRPEASKGDDIPWGARIARLSTIAVLFESIGGVDASARAVRRRGGGMLDPVLAANFSDRAANWLAELGEGDVRGTVLELEPDPQVTVTELRSVAAVFGDLADLKSPCFLGHSRGVAALAGRAAQLLHLSADAAADVEAAGLLHDVGRVAVSNAVWDKPGTLSTDEWEQVRLHPYYSERILSGSDALSRLAPMVGRHHERLDGSGYHRGCVEHDLDVSARVLAAADCYQTLIEPRPHRAQLEPDQAAQRLLDEVVRGTLDGDAVGTVLAAAGQAAAPVVTTPRHGLSDREIEVLELVARGCSNAEIAARLFISRRTAEHHVQHIYAKIGVRSRAAATLFGVEHGLVGHK